MAPVCILVEVNWAPEEIRQALPCGNTALEICIACNSLRLLIGIQISRIYLLLKSHLHESLSSPKGPVLFLGLVKTASSLVAGSFWESNLIHNFSFLFFLVFDCPLHTNPFEPVRADRCAGGSERACCVGCS